jgi:hypothetical protein
LSFFYKEIKGYSYIFSIFPISIIFLYLFIPFKIFIYKLRLGVIIQFLKSFYPFVKNLGFKEYISCDIVNSITYPLISLAIAICLFSCKECRLNEERNYCIRQNAIGIVIQILPVFAKVLQCLHRIIFPVKKSETEEDETQEVSEPKKSKKLLYTCNTIKYCSKIGFIFITYYTKISIYIFIINILFYLFIFFY